MMYSYIDDCKDNIEDIKGLILSITIYKYQIMESLNKNEKMNQIRVNGLNSTMKNWTGYWEFGNLECFWNYKNINLNLCNNRLICKRIEEYLNSF